MDKAWHIYRRWLRDRRRSTMVWSASIAMVSVVTGAFYGSLGQTAGQNADSDSAVSSMLGLGSGIDPRTPVGFLWSMNYSNQLPWLLMALAIALGTAAIAGDESEGTLEYLLSKPVTRTQVALARFGGMVTILVIASIVNLVAVAVTAPLFDLTDAVSIAEPDGTTTMAAGVTVWDLTDPSAKKKKIGINNVLIRQRLIALKCVYNCYWLSARNTYAIMYICAKCLDHRRCLGMLR